MSGTERKKEEEVQSSASEGKGETLCGQRRVSVPSVGGEVEGPLWGALLMWRVRPAGQRLWTMQDTRWTKLRGSEVHPKYTGSKKRKIRVDSGSYRACYGTRNLHADADLLYSGRMRQGGGPGSFRVQGHKAGAPCCERVGTKLGVRPVSGVAGWGLGEGADWQRTGQGRGRRGRLPNAKSSWEVSWPGTTSGDSATAMSISQELFGTRGGWEWRDPVSGSGRGKITLLVGCDVSQIHINKVKISELVLSTYMCQERF